MLDLQQTVPGADQMEWKDIYDKIIEKNPKLGSILSNDESCIDYCDPDNDDYYIFEISRIDGDTVFLQKEAT